MDFRGTFTSFTRFSEDDPPQVSKHANRANTNVKRNLFEESDSDELVQVYLRVKPTNTPNSLYAICDNNSFVTSVDTTSAGHGRRTQNNVSKLYTFSHIFGPDASQKEIFEHIVKNNLRKLITDGQSYTLLTYGASGSGKTFTLMGTEESPGLVPRSLEYIFKFMDAAQYPVYKPMDGQVDRLSYEQQSHELQWVSKLRNVSAPVRDKYRRMSVRVSTDFTASTIDLTEKTQYYVWVSFVEVYNEAIYDLLVPSERRIATKLNLREDTSGNVHVKGARHAFVRSGAEAYDIMVAGRQNLQVAATGVHAHSSRSHCIFTITLLTDTSDGVKMSSVKLCDLAGSERAKRTGNTGTRMAESRAINTSLHVLERCLHALRRNQPNTFVPYRESKLTRLLGSGLSGARGEPVTMLVTVNTSPRYINETRHVLQLASVAKDIQINNTIFEHSSTLSSNDDISKNMSSGAEIMQLRAENERLEFELMQLLDTHKKLQASIEEERANHAKSTKEIVQEVKDMSKQYYEAQLESMREQLESIKEQHTAEMNEVLKEVQTAKNNNSINKEQLLKILSVSKANGDKSDISNIMYQLRLYLEDTEDDEEVQILERKHSNSDQHRRQSVKRETSSIADESVRESCYSEDQGSDRQSDNMTTNSTKDDIRESIISNQEDGKLYDTVNESTDENLNSNHEHIKLYNSVSKSVTTSLMSNDTDRINLQDSENESSNKSLPSTHEDRKLHDSFNECTEKSQISNHEEMELHDSVNKSTNKGPTSIQEERQIHDLVNESADNSLIFIDEDNLHDSLNKSAKKSQTCNNENDKLFDSVINESANRIANLTIDDSITSNGTISPNSTNEQSKRGTYFVRRSVSERVSLGCERVGLNLVEEVIEEIPMLNKHVSSDDNRESGISEKTQESSKDIDSSENGRANEQVNSKKLLTRSSSVNGSLTLFEKYEDAVNKEIEAENKPKIIEEGPIYNYKKKTSFFGNLIKTEAICEEIDEDSVSGQNIFKPEDEAILINSPCKTVIKQKLPKVMSLDIFESPHIEFKEPISIIDKCVEKFDRSSNKLSLVHNHNSTAEFFNFTQSKTQDKDKIDGQKLYQTISHDNTENVESSDNKSSIVDSNDNEEKSDISENIASPTYADCDQGNVESIHEKTSLVRHTDGVKQIQSECDEDNISSVIIIDDKPNITEVETFAIPFNKSLVIDKKKESFAVNKESLLTVNDTKASENDTLDAFESICKDLTTSRATEFELLVKNESNIHEEIKDTEFSVPKINDNTNNKNAKYNFRNKRNIDKSEEKVLSEIKNEEPEKQTRSRRTLRLRRGKNVDESNENITLKSIENLKAEYCDMISDKPEPTKVVREPSLSPEKAEGSEENIPPTELQSCPAKSTARSRRKLFTPRAEPLEQSPGDSGGRPLVPRPSYTRGKARRRL